MNIGNNVIIGLGSSVIHYVGYEDIVAGVPAMSIKNKATIDDYERYLMGGQKNEQKEQGQHNNPPDKSNSQKKKFK